MKREGKWGWILGIGKERDIFGNCKSAYCMQHFILKKSEILMVRLFTCVFHLCLSYLNAIGIYAKH
jgi:hypothetical protein